MRKIDREKNGFKFFPKLYYPELYLLEGGYKDFYHAYNVSWAAVLLKIVIIPYNLCCNVLHFKNFFSYLWLFMCYTCMLEFVYLYTHTHTQNVHYVIFLPHFICYTIYFVGGIL